MAEGYFRDRGAYHVCPTCGKSFYILEPDLWVFKMTPSIGKYRDTLVYFCKYTHLKQYREEYEIKVKERRHQAAVLRNKKKFQDRKQLEAYLSGKCCGECRYCIKGKYGFYDCSVSSYSVGQMKAACKRFKPLERVVGNGNSGQKAVT